MDVPGGRKVERGKERPRGRWTKVERWHPGLAFQLLTLSETWFDRSGAGSKPGPGPVLGGCFLLFRSIPMLLFMSRVFNFAAGPCTLPLQVLEEARDEFVDYHGAGSSLIEMSHRGREYSAVHEEAMDLARSVAGAPAEFDVLFLQGGATLQFAMVPMNLLSPGKFASVAVTGSWSQAALADGSHHGDLRVAWDGAESGYSRMPTSGELDVPSGARYLHICSNETIGGIRYPGWPEVDVPLVVDMSSEYLARPIPWDRVDVVFGGVQKNLGPAGMAIVYIRQSAVAAANDDLAAYLRYSVHAAKDSLYNTPPVFTIWMTGKVLRWMQDQGGISAIEAASAQKSGLVYRVIDEGWYRSPVAEADRSHMNVVWRLPSEELEAEFIAEATGRGMPGLKGHRSVGGVRASMYAAMPEDGAVALAAFMEEFRSRHV